MELWISNSSDKPIYEQIVTQLKNKIISGVLESGELLPSIRVLAKELKISVITTKRAYEELEKDGFIETVAGKGSFVSQKNTEFIKEEQLKRVEKKLLEAILIAHTSALSLEELTDLLTLLYKEDEK